MDIYWEGGERDDKTDKTFAILEKNLRTGLGRSSDFVPGKVEDSKMGKRPAKEHASVARSEREKQGKE